MASDHKRFIRESFRLAEQAGLRGDEPFGALLVAGGRIVSRSENLAATSGDATRHAELSLVSAAMRELDAKEITGATLYASTEPCPMCAGAIYWSRIPRIVFGCSAEAFSRISGGGLNISCRDLLSTGRRQVEVIGPLLEEEALEIHRRLWRKRLCGATSDGRGRMPAMVMKRFENPDETRRFEKGKFEIVQIGSMTLGRARYEPGWKWSEHVGPMTGSTLCAVEHVGLVVSGRACVRMTDGSEMEMKPGDLFFVGPGHDSWVVGEEPYVSIHFLGAEEYAAKEDA